MRTFGRVVAGLIGLLLVLGGGLWVKGTIGLLKVRDLPRRPITVVSDSATIARGKHLALSIIKCVACHGHDLGGRLMADAGPLGIIYGTNLTKGVGGKGGQYDDAAIARAIRHGVTIAGRPIHIMPAETYSTASDRDVGAVIAYVR